MILTKKGVKYRYNCKYCGRLTNGKFQRCGFCKAELFRLSLHPFEINFLINKGFSINQLKNYTSKKELLKRLK